MKLGLTISAVGHAGVLLWAVVRIAAAPLNAPPVESMPIDIVSTKEFSELRAGAHHAPKAETPKPLVEKIAERKAVENPAAKVVEKPQIINASAEAPPPAPPPPKPKVPDKPVEPVVPQTQSEPKPKAKEADKKDHDPKPDPIAEALKKEELKKSESKPEPKKAEVKPAPPKKPEPRPQPKFDADRIAALLDKREPQRVAAAGDTLNRTLALGTRTGESAQLSQSELDALRAKLKQCWNPPAGAANAEKRRVPIIIRFNRDGTLSSPPEPGSVAGDPYTQAMVESAVRATYSCQPYSMLSPAKYEIWKEIEIDFSLDEMFGG